MLGAAAKPQAQIGAFAHAARARTRERLVGRAAGAVYASTAAWALTFVAATVVRHLTFGTARFDLGNMTQAVWSTANGRVLEITDLAGGQVSRLGSHVDPLLALLAPLWWIWPSPLVLLVFQVLVVSAGALPVYWLACSRLGSSRAGSLFALAYLAYPATQWNAFTPVSGFHPASLALPLLLFAVWFLERQRLWAFAAVALLAAATKEHMPLAVGCLGLWYAVAHRRPFLGGAIFGLGTVATLVNFLVVIPHFSAAGEHALTYRYEHLGRTPAEILTRVVTDPGTVASTVATGHKLAFLALLFAPFLGLWLRAPLLLLGAVPELAIDLLSRDPNQTSIAFHYTAGIAPFVVAASVVGASRIGFLRRERLALYAFAGVSSVAVLSPLMFVPADVRALFEHSSLRARAEAVALVPPEAAVSSTNALGAHLSDRRRIFTFPVIRDANWVVVDMADDDYLAEGGPRPADFERLRRDRRFVLVRAAGSILVFRRTGRG